MLHILADSHRPTLASFASSNVLLGFDYDGTLAPITADPAVARMRPRTRRLLTAVAQRYPCVIISGRSQRDVLRRVAGIPVFHVSGNHGLEPWDEDAAYAASVHEWTCGLKRRLASYRGVVIENKTYSLTIHYRNSRSKPEALTAIRAAIRLVRGARVLGGKYAISLIPRGAPTKGAALERVRQLLACDAAIYVGDDETDEDAFRVGRSHRLLAIRVGGRRGSHAKYRLRSQQEIDDLLRVLHRLRGSRHLDR